MASNPPGGFGPTTTTPTTVPDASGLDIGSSMNPVSNQGAGGSSGLGGTSGAMGGFGGSSGMGSTSSGMGSSGMGSTSGMGGTSGLDTGDMKHQAQGAVDQARDQAMKLKDQALDQARSAAEEGKTKAATTLTDVAQNVRQAADQLSQNSTIAPVGKYANQAADAIEDFASSLRNKDVDQLFTEVSGFVRRNPAIAAGVAVAAGFALVRLLSPARDGQQRFGGGYDDQQRFVGSNENSTFES